MLATSQFSNGMTPIGFKLLTRNESMKYVPQTDYMFLHFVQGNSTEIRQINDYFYEVVINNCEILPAMERIMLEVLVKEKGVK